MKILIVEDEKDLRNSLEKQFQKEGFIVETASTAQEAEEKAGLYQYSVIILDIMLPDGNGLNVLELIKKEQARAGVLILSAKNALDDKISGLERGADDYLTKPFHFPELLARVKAILRRRWFEGNKKIRFHEIEVNPDSNETWVNGKAISLHKKERDLLLFLLANKNRVLSKATIAEHLWGDYMDLADNFDLVYSHVKNLRKKLGQAGAMDYIQTIYGMGYKFSDH
jgi:DNA-binding response OmpR family regulator